MGIPELIEQLAAPDMAAREAAGAALVAAGAGAVEPVLAVLCDEASPVYWGDSAGVLRRIGDPAFDPVLDVIVSPGTEEVRRRARWAFGGIEVSDLTRYADVLAHPDPSVRETAAFVLQNAGSAALPLAPALVPLLTDADEDVRQRGVWAFAGIGPGVIPLLRGLRRSAAPQGRQALTALAEVGGWDALDAADQRLVERLIAVKLRDEKPAPMHLCGGWYALPTKDQGAVLEAFGLSDAMPVTMRLGESAWNSDHHGGTLRHEHGRCARTYVSPVLDGWTLVFGDPPGLAHSASAETDSGRRQSIRHSCAELSDAFGAAHWYGASCGDGWTAWCLAEHGRIIRCYDVFEPEDQLGNAHAAEDGYLLPHEDRGLPEGWTDGIDISDAEAFRERYEQVKRDFAIPDPCHATDIAGRLSVDPSELDERTSVLGCGVLALTACGRRYGTPRGALRI
ncbi:HEAT repeat domain-containing protein [Amycolatopsis sp. NPDC049688]|uniref:HEAT repeat domain-containing protein n=1 Tax=Amycolatopsis sp. NPDC049688 TaxID=3154733 RepID=UPI00341543EF